MPTRSSGNSTSASKVGVDIAAVLMEPIQGEAGAIVPPDDFWPRLREMTKRYGVLLIADEVQTGLGRTGKLWGVDHWNVVAGHYGRRQVAGRRRDADQRLLLDRGNLAGHDAPQPLHPHHDHGRRSLGVQRRHRRHQRHAAASGCGSRPPPRAITSSPS